MSALRERRRSDGSLLSPGGQASAYGGQQGMASPPAGTSPYAGYGGYGGYPPRQSPPAAQQQAASPYGGYGGQQPAAHAATASPSHYNGYPHSGGGGGGGGLAVGYGGYGQSTSSASLSGDESKNPRGKKRHGGGGKSAATFSLAWQLTVILAVTTVALLGATLHYRSRYTHHKKHTHHHTTQQEKKLNDLHQHKTSIQDELEGKAKHVGFLEDRVGELQKELDSIKHDVKEADGRAQRREEVLRGRMLNMIGRVRKESHRATLDRFGPGPYQVEITLELPADPNHHPTIPVNPTLLINLYHQEMPHATHVFLEQVAHQLWDGCAFAVNADHVLQTAPVDAVTGHDRTPAFVEKELDILSFQEYSDQHPHKRYTVGFTGRPAGPGFYVNKLDNSEDNGPGGQGETSDVLCIYILYRTAMGILAIG